MRIHSSGGDRIHGDQFVADLKRVIADRQDRAIDRIDQDGVVVEIDRHAQVGREAGRHRERGVRVMERGHVFRLNLKELQVVFRGSHAIDPRPDIEQVESE
jgi:hypothetical protein